MKRAACAYLLVWLVIAASFFGVAGAAETPGELKVQIRLIWGTNEAKPDDPKLKELEGPCKGWMQKFKWKNYWEVDRKTVSLPPGQSKKVPVSKLCEVELKHLDKQNFEVKLFGEKKLVDHRMRESLANGRPLIIAGDDKNDSAWFVVITLSPENDPAKPVAAAKP